MQAPSPREVSPAQFAEARRAISAIDDAARRADGHPALGDAVWIDLEHPGADSAGYLAGRDGYAHVARSDTGALNTAPAGTGRQAHWTLGLALTPEARATGLRPILVVAALAHVARRGGGLVTLWLLGAGPADDAELATAGLRAARDLYEMRVGLPLGLDPKWAPGIVVRHFEPGRDEQAWLEVNNRAFAGHAEQGDWTVDTLARRTAEPWFDPALFLLAFDDAGLVGFDWLKVHDAHEGDPRLGEIYVVGVDPRAQGRGLGRSLAVAGLDAVHARGLSTGMLFCAADNQPALHLYRALGFDVHRTDRAYECEVPA